MHHYTTVLSVLGVRDNVAYIWRHFIPHEAFKHAFLMHGLLAFSALHLAFLIPDNSPKYLQLCDKHQSIALQHFRSILSSPVDPELANALLAQAATLSISSMARSCALSKTEVMSMDSVMELFILTKGIANVINLAKEHIARGPLGEMLQNTAYPPGMTIPLPIGVVSRFEAMRLMLTSPAQGLEQDDLEHCQNALTGLEDVYKNIVYFSRTSDVDIGPVSQWQVKVSMGYIKLVQEHNAPALIILAYYAAAITAIRKAWYTHNWAKYALRGISSSLKPDMQHWLQWPLQQVQDKMCELGVRSPVDEGVVSDKFATFTLT